jgi:hypothetical protein
MAQLKVLTFTSGVRVEAEFIRRLSRLATRFGNSPAGAVVRPHNRRSALIRRALELGLAQLERDLGAA